jgi:hypothetical protein
MNPWRPISHDKAVLDDLHAAIQEKGLWHSAIPNELDRLARNATKGVIAHSNEEIWFG